MSLLHVENLHVCFGKTKAVRGISFSVEKGESVGIVGESGSGKTAAIHALTGLSEASLVSGKAMFDGEDLLKKTELELRKIRGKKIGMMFQDPFVSLNPTMRIGAQIVEGPLYHKLIKSQNARAEAIEWLRLVGVPDPASRIDQYPIQLSGGTRQRVTLAIAAACHPSLLIADEPTTALDVTVQAQILELLKQMQKQLKMGLLMITHDIGVVSSVCDRVLVMHGGKIVEQGSVEEVLLRPKHPYTQMLLHARRQFQGTFV